MKKEPVKGITLKQAQARHKIVKAAKDRHDEKIIQEGIKKINYLIALNLEEIKINPVLIDERIIFETGKQRDAITESFKEFTVDICISHFFVKLADKDWDWNGYGIKEQREKILAEVDKRCFSNLVDKLCKGLKNK